MSLLWSGWSLSIGTSIFSGTPGSVLFVGPTGDLSQNNPNLFWDNSTNRLGIGTSTPGATLEVNGNIISSGANPLIFTSIGTGSLNKTVWYHDLSNGFGFDLARVTDSGVATPINFFLKVRGADYPIFKVNGTTGNAYFGNGNYPIADPTPKGVIDLGGGTGNVVLINGSYAPGVTSDGLQLRYNNSDNTTVSLDSRYDSAAAVMNFNLRAAGASPVTPLTLLGNGNVGIGTASPAYVLDVNGIIATSNANPMVFTSLGNGTYNKTVWYHTTSLGFGFDLARATDSGSDTALNFFLSARGNNFPVFKVNGTTGNAYFGNGNSQLSDPTPTGVIDLGGGIGNSVLINGSYAVGVTGEGVQLKYNNAGNTTVSLDSRYDSAGAVMNFNLRTSGTPVTALTLLGSGNVGIGTQTPAAPLQIGAGFAPFSSNTKLLIGSTSSSTDFQIGQDVSHNMFFSWIYNSTPANAAAALGTFNGNNPLLLQAGGGFAGVGLTAPATQFDINGGSLGPDTNYAALRVTNSSTTYGPELRLVNTGTGGQDWRIGSGQASNSAGTGNLFFYNIGSAADLMVLKPNGNLGLGTTSPTAKLDITLTTGATPTAGLALINPTAAASGAQQFGPAILWQGAGWKTNTTAASLPIQVRAFLSTSQGTSSPGFLWRLQGSINGSSFTDMLSISQTGGIFTPGAITTGGNANIGGGLSVGADLAISGLLAFNQRLKSFSSNFVYNEDTRTLSIGTANVDSRDAALFATSNNSTPRVISTVPTSFTATLINVETSATVTSATATQSVGVIGRPNSPSISQNFGGSFYPGNAGDFYEMQIWVSEGSNFSPAPSSIVSFTDTGAGPFQIDYSWSSPSFGAPVFYLIALRINSGAWMYVNVGNTALYSDNDGSYPDAAPSSFTGDYVAIGTTRNYKAYGIYSLNTHTYLSASAYDYSMTDDASGEAYQVQHSISPAGSAVSARVLGNADGVTFDGAADGTTLYENSVLWANSVVLTPTSYGYLSNGTTLNRDYSFDTWEMLGGVETYSGSPITQSTVDPNDGLYYYVQLDCLPNGNTGATYKVVITSLSLARKDTVPTFYDDDFVAFSDSTTVTPTSYVVPAGKFSKDCASSTDSPVLEIQSTNASTPTPMTHFIDSTGVVLGKLYVDSSGNLKYIGKNGTSTTLAPP